MKIEISKLKAVADERIQIKISDLKPQSILKIITETELPWCLGEKFSSYAIFNADNNGEVDLDLMKPIEGTYKMADSMGIIYSLKKSTSVGKNIAENICIDNPIIINVKFESEGNQEEERKLKRIFKTDDVNITYINEEFFAKLYTNNNAKDKVIILLNGSSGDMKALDLIAGPLCSRGFNVLNIPYFAAPGLPENLEEVPLEHFEKVFRWVQNNNVIEKKNKAEKTEIYLLGISKGSEAALLLASKYSEIKKVAAIEAHGYVFQGLKGQGFGDDVSSWSYDGQSIPFIKGDNNIFYEELKKCNEQGIPFGFGSTYKKCVELAANKEEARIKVENSEADLLIATGKKDNIWNGYDGCKVLVDNLKKHNYKHSVEFLVYEHMGHPAPIPYIIPLNETTSMPMMGGIFSSGGTLEGNAEAQHDLWEKTIEFFNK